MIILYGTQGGTSREVAKLIQNIIENGYSKDCICDIQNQNLSNSVMEMNDFDLQKILDIDCIIFVCSTHGDGTEPFNMTRFWNSLKKIKVPGFLSHLHFAVFGLGDSSYDLYNYCSKKLFNLLVRLGAKPLLRRGCGDAQDKEGWLSDFRPWVCELLKNEAVYSLQNVDQFRNSGDKEYSVRVIYKKEITPANYQHPMLEIRLKIENYNSFKPGDCLGIRPENYNLKDIMNYTNISHPKLKDLDFNGIPQIIFFSYLYQFVVRSELEVCQEKVDKIKELFRDYSFYHDYIIKPKRTILETLEELGIKPSLDFILQYIPRIPTRYFTLNRVNDEFSILISLVSYKTILKDERKGICSEFLKRDVKEMKCVVGQSMLNIKKDKILVICTGAGVSLALSLINFYTDKEIVIFYGFRYKSKDSIIIEDKENVKVYYVSSRESGRYVQDVFRMSPVQNIDSYEIVVSGNSRLNKIVREMFNEIYGRKIPFYCETW